MSASSVVFEDAALLLPRPIPSLAYMTHTDEGMRPFSLVVSMLIPFHRELRLMNADRGTLDGALPIRDEAVLDLHRDAILTLNRTHLIVSELDIGRDVKRTVAKSFKNPYRNWRTRVLMLAMTPRVKLTSCSEVGVTDFRDDTPGASYLIPGGNSSFVTAVKANCRAYFWDLEGEMLTLHAGALRRTGSKLGLLIDAQALSDVSPIVCLFGQDVSTHVFDVRREAVLTRFENCVSPLYVGGVPQYIGINRPTNKLEIVA